MQTGRQSSTHETLRRADALPTTAATAAENATCPAGRQHVMAAQRTRTTARTGRKRRASDGKALATSRTSTGSARVLTGANGVNRCLQRQGWWRHGRRQARWRWRAGARLHGVHHAPHRELGHALAPRRARSPHAHVPPLVGRAHDVKPAGREALREAGDKKQEPEAVKPKHESHGPEEGEVLLVVEEQDPVRGRQDAEHDRDHEAGVAQPVGALEGGG